MNTSTGHHYYHRHAQWLDALVQQVPWKRCGVEQGYFASAGAVQEANALVPGLEGIAVEAGYAGYVAWAEGLCGG